MRVNFDHGPTKWVMDEMVRGSGATIRYLSEVTNVKKQGNLVTGVVLNDNTHIPAKVS